MARRLRLLRVRAVDGGAAWRSEAVRNRALLDGPSPGYEPYYGRERSLPFVNATPVPRGAHGRRDRANPSRADAAAPQNAAGRNRRRGCLYPPWTRPTGSATSAVLGFFFRGF